MGDWLKIFSFDLQRGEAISNKRKTITLTDQLKEPSTSFKSIQMMPTAALDIKHGSGAIKNDPTEMAQDAQSANPNQTGNMQQAVTPQATRNANESIEWSLSESSPGQPAMARPGAELPPPGRPRRSPAPHSSRGRTRLTMRSPSMGGKRSTSRLSMMARHQPERMQSPAVERVEIEKHRVIRPEVPPGTTGPSMLESRVGALEQQQAID